MSEPFGSEVEDRLHKVSEVASIFSVTDQTIRSWCKERNPNKRMNSIKVGRQLRISRQAMVDYANRTYQ